MNVNAKIRTVGSIKAEHTLINDQGRVIWLENAENWLTTAGLSRNESFARKTCSNCVQRDREVCKASIWDDTGRICGWRKVQSTAKFSQIVNIAVISVCQRSSGTALSRGVAQRSIVEIITEDGFRLS